MTDTKAPLGARVPSQNESIDRTASDLSDNRLRIIRQLALFGGHVSRDEVAAMAQELIELRARIADQGDIFDEAWNAGAIATLNAASEELHAAEAGKFTAEERLRVLARATGDLENPYPKAANR